MTKTEKEKQIQALKNLGLTDEEVTEVLADDEKIDKGAKLFELPDELKEGRKRHEMPEIVKDTPNQPTERKKLTMTKDF